MNWTRKKNSAEAEVASAQTICLEVTQIKAGDHCYGTGGMDVVTATDGRAYGQSVAFTVEPGTVKTGQVVLVTVEVIEPMTDADVEALVPAEPS